MILEQFSIVPPDLLDKDPRPFAYMYPDSIRSNDQKFIGFIKKMQRFTFLQAVAFFEEYGKRNGMLLIPAKVLHWRRRNELGVERRVRIGRNTFYFLRVTELTKKEQEKLLDHAEQIRSEVI